jgi:hypothetical protein
VCRVRDACYTKIKKDLDPKEEDEEDEKQEAIVSRRTAYVLCVIMG